MVVCRECGAHNADAHRFCATCGTGLTSSCPACGEAVVGGQRFCPMCGHALAAAAAAQPEAVLLPAPPAAERRICSVLFADLVGFTPLSESRDPEEVRELLSEYFEATRTVITRYGGVVEKFIGDAVMAVWGTPVATEGALAEDRTDVEGHRVYVRLPTDDADVEGHVQPPIDH